jgi:predicted deacylase
MSESSFEINGETIAPGEKRLVALSVPRLNSSEQAIMPLHVLHSKKPGPRLFISATIHGDELNGIEIVRRLISHKSMKRLRGTLIAIPVVNVYGLVHASRYLPDRRDLNRSFPGSERGSLAARVAHLFMKEVVTRCTHGIDLHTGAIHRTNLPQIRANLDDPATLSLARAFGVPVLINSSLRDGSLRACAAGAGVPMLLYEAGEALRYDELSIRAGVQGIINVMRALDMLPPSPQAKPTREPFIAYRSQWQRAPETGMLRSSTPLGAVVAAGDLLGEVDDPFNNTQHPITAAVGGLVIGRAQSPLVHEGDAVFHIARFLGDSDSMEENLASFREAQEAARELDEEPYIV